MAASDHEGPPADGWIFGGGGDAELAGLLYGGETLVEEVPVGTARVAVTSHRVLALTPEGDGPRLGTAHLPNVTGVASRARGDRKTGVRALRAGVYAALLLGAGWLVDLGGLIRPVEAPSGVGIGGVVSMVNALVEVLGLVDEALLVGGLVALAVALFFAGRYAQGRSRHLEIEVAGDDPLQLPAEGGGAAERIEAAVEKASNASASNPG